jgi:Ca-activated chloride channel homolog
VRFTDPLWLILFLPVFAGLVLSWRHVHGMAKGRKRTAFVLRAVLAGSLVLALAGPQLWRPNRGVAVVFVVDRSHSVSEAERARSDAFVDRALSGLGPDDVGAVVAFGATPVIESMPSGRRSVSAARAKIDGAASDLASALRLASAAMPDGKAKRIVVVTDGNETRGDAVQAAEAAAVEGIQIDTVTLGVDEKSAEAAVVELRAPSERRAGEPFEVRAVLESTVGQDAELVLDRDGVVVSRTPVRLSPGKTTVVVPQKLEGAGFYRYRASLVAAKDRDNRNNIGASFTTVRGKPRVLVLQGDTGHTELADALRAQGLAVDLLGPSGVPARPEELQPYDAVYLNDIPAQLMDKRQMALLQAAVRDTGIGLAMVGGEGSFLPGGWYGTPVAEALPVDLNVRQRKTFPSTTVLIVVDASGSMAMVEDGLQKIQLAALAAVETVKLLSSLDRVGVAGSTDGIEFVAPIQDLKDKASVTAQIKKLGVGGGGIYAEPSVEFAAKELRKQNTKVRHFLLLADGADVDTYGRSLEIIREMQAEKITTSVVAIGDGKDVPFLKLVAAAGGGRFYLATQASKLPAIFTQDVALMSRSAIEELTFVPEVRPGLEALRGVDPSSLPALFAYCLADARPLAQVGLVSPKKDPILATWQYGLGTSLAFTSDAQSRWASRWIGWDGFGRFWAQATRSISRRLARNDYEVSVRPEGGKGVVEVRAMDRLSNPLGATELDVRVSGPDGTATEVSLRQEAPGVFRGAFDAADLGSYIVAVSEPGGREGARVATTGFSIPYPPEYRSQRPNAPLLAGLADATGGQPLKEPTEALRPVATPGETVTDVWLWFLLAGALLLPLDVAVRRLALPWADLVRMRFGRSVEAEAEPRDRFSRLREAKVRAVEKSAPPVAPQTAPRRPPEATQSAASRLLKARKDREEP